MNGFQAFLGGTLSAYEAGALPLLRGKERIQSDDAPRRTLNLSQVRTRRCAGSPDLQVLLCELQTAQRPTPMEKMIGVGAIIEGRVEISKRWCEEVGSILGAFLPSCWAQKGRTILKNCICPHCKLETGIGTAALFNTVLMSRKTCDKCGRQFVIINDVPMTEEQYRMAS